MKVELTATAAEWVEAQIAAGHFANAEQAISHAIETAKLSRLRETIEASIARGGDNSADDVLQHVKSQLAGHAKKAS